VDSDSRSGVSPTPDVSAPAPSPEIVVAADMEEVEEPDTSTGEVAVPGPSEEYRQRFKRTAPSELEDLDRERLVRMMNTILVRWWIWISFFARFL